MATDAQAWDVLFALADKLGIDPEEARKADGKPSDVFMKHIGRIERERDQLAAQVEKFTNFTRFVQKCVSKNGEYAPLTGLEMRELLSVEPSKCLARRDDRMKAEALECLQVEANRTGADMNILILNEYIRAAAESYRKQAEGES